MCISFGPLLTSRDVHWPEAGESCTSRETSEAHLRNGGIDDAVLTELVEETLRHLHMHVRLISGEAE